SQPLSASSSLTGSEYCVFKSDCDSVLASWRTTWTRLVVTLLIVTIFITIITALFYAFFILRLSKRCTWSLKLTQLITSVLRWLYCIIFHFSLSQQRLVSFMPRICKYGHRYLGELAESPPYNSIAL